MSKRKMGKVGMFSLAALLALGGGLAYAKSANAPSVSEPTIQGDSPAPLGNSPAQFPALPTSTPNPTNFEQFCSAYGEVSCDTLGGLGYSDTLRETAARDYLAVSEELLAARERGFPVDYLISNGVTGESAGRLIGPWMHLASNWGGAADPNHFDAQEYIDEALRLSKLESEIVVSLGVPYQSSINGRLIATPDVIGELEIQSAIDGGYGQDLTGIFFNDSDSELAKLNADADYSLRSFTGIHPFLARAQQWISQNPGNMHYDHDNVSFFTQDLPKVIAENDYVDLVFEGHGTGRGLTAGSPGVIFLGPTEGRDMPIAIPDFADYAARAIAQAEDRPEKIVFRLIQCGGYPVAEQFLTALSQKYAEYGIPAEELSNVYVQIPSDNGEKDHLFNFPDYAISQFAQMHNFGGTDIAWGYYNGEGRVVTGTDGAGSRFTYVTDSLDMRHVNDIYTLDLNVQTYQISPAGEIGKVPYEAQALLRPIKVETYAP